MKACVYIPIKTNNTRLPGKTFKLLSGKPLYSYLFNTVKKLEVPVYIDSSDDEVLKIAKNNGFIALKRPEAFNADNIAGNDLLKRVIDQIDEDIICFCHITSPFLKVETITKSIIQLEQNKSLDSLFGVTPVFNRCWFKNKPINHDPNNLLRTQDLTPVYVEAADLYIVKKDSFKKYGKRVCGNYNQIEVDSVEAADIDTLTDFIHAESLLNSGIVNFKWA